jgi:hypothetical protein
MSNKKIKPMNLIFAVIVLVMFGGMEVLLVLTKNVPPPNVQICLIMAMLLVCLACVFPEGALAFIKSVPAWGSKAKSLISFNKNTEIEKTTGESIPKPPTED